MLSHRRVAQGKRVNLYIKPTNPTQHHMMANWTEDISRPAAFAGAVAYSGSTSSKTMFPKTSKLFFDFFFCLDNPSYTFDHPQTFARIL